MNINRPTTFFLMNQVAKQNKLKINCYRFLDRLPLKSYLCIILILLIKTSITRPDNFNDAKSQRYTNKVLSSIIHSGKPLNHSVKEWVSILLKIKFSINELHVY